MKKSHDFQSIALLFSESQTRQFSPKRFNICGYTLDKCKSIYFNSDIILVRHIFLHYFLKASCLANDRWLLGVLFFLPPLHNTAGTHHFATENNTLFGFLDRSEVGCICWNHTRSVTFTPFLLPFFIGLKAIWIKLTKFYG